MWNDAPMILSPPAPSQASARARNWTIRWPTCTARCAKRGWPTQHWALAACSRSICAMRGWPRRFRRACASGFPAGKLGSEIGGNWGQMKIFASHQSLRRGHGSGKGSERVVFFDARSKTLSGTLLRRELRKSHGICRCTGIADASVLIAAHA